MQEVEVQRAPGRADAAPVQDRDADKAAAVEAAPGTAPMPQAVVDAGQIGLKLSRVEAGYFVGHRLKAEFSGADAVDAVDQLCAIDLGDPIDLVGLQDPVGNTCHTAAATHACGAARPGRPMSSTPARTAIPLRSAACAKK